MNERLGPIVSLLAAQLAEVRASQTVLLRQNAALLAALCKEPTGQVLQQFEADVAEEARAARAEIVLQLATLLDSHAQKDDEPPQGESGNRTS